MVLHSSRFQKERGRCLNPGSARFAMSVGVEVMQHTDAVLETIPSPAIRAFRQPCIVRKTGANGERISSEKAYCSAGTIIWLRVMRLEIPTVMPPTTRIPSQMVPTHECVATSAGFGVPFSQSRPR